MLPKPKQLTPENAASCYSTIKAYEQFDLAGELEKRDLFRKLGEKETSPHLSNQRIEDYINSFHSRSGLARSAMPAEEAQAFDEALREAVLPWSHDGSLTLVTQARVVWGRPL